MKLNCRIAALGFSLLLPATCAASAGGKNREGNRLFQEKKYEDAEKAYLEARAEDPDRPEILYNLGNALVRQKKYQNAVQTLLQAIAKGEKGLQASSWYNAGNAFYEAGDFGEAARAFTQSLRHNPADRDAKHNLELALKKLEEPQQNPPQGKDQKDKNQAPQKDASAGNRERESQPEKGTPKGQDSPAPQDSPRPVDPEGTRSDGGDGSFTRERALQILDALQNQELAEQRKLLERRARQKATGKDW